MQNKPQQPLKHLKDLDLNALEKPKTLIILHYKQRRISVPFFKEVYNLGSLLYNHISTLEQKILSNDPNWQKKAKQQIVCFQIKKQSKNQAEKLGDGDQRTDILLSLLRIQGEPAIEELTLRTDVTKIFKYLQIEPYYRYFDSEPSHYLSPESTKSAYFSFQRLLQTTPNANYYLARRINDGYFFCIKVYVNGSKLGEKQAKNNEGMLQIDQQNTQGRSNLLLRSQQVVLIPHPQVQQQEQEQDLQNCRHITLIYPYFVKGTLQEYFQQARIGRKRIQSMDCLNYIKQLMWGIHILHQKYNLIHRALSPSNILVDQNGQLKLASFGYCIPCYDSQGQYARYINRSKYSKYGQTFQQLSKEQNFEMGEYMSPQMLGGQYYNYLTDFYSIGMILKRLFELSQAQQRAPVSQNNQKTMLELIQKLTSHDLERREQIVQEMLDGIGKEEEFQSNQAVLNMPTHNLTLQDIKVGRYLQLSGSKKYIESQQDSNGIEHEIIINFFKKPLIPKISKVTKKRKVSKDKISVNSRQKSQKCLSKASQSLYNSSQIKNRKISYNKSRLLNNKKQQHSKDSKEKNKSQNSSHKNKNPQDLLHKKTSKSKSHQRKKQPTLGAKQYTSYDQQKIPIVPRGPKNVGIVPRQKSPAVRENLFKRF